jgi:dihydrofolate reductase
MALESNCINEMYITYVQGVFGADTFFPDFDESQWEQSILGHQAPDEKHSHGFVITKHVKK